MIFYSKSWYFYSTGKKEIVIPAATVIDPERSHLKREE